jgi:hypothetical protein
MQAAMLKGWLSSMLHHAASLACITGTPSGRKEQTWMLVAFVLIFDLVIGILQQLHSDLPTAAHLVTDLCNEPYKLDTLLKYLAAVAREGTEAAREAPEELLLGQGMLLRWLGRINALEPGRANCLIQLARSILLKHPIAVGKQALAVDAKAARQVIMGAVKVLQAVQHSATTQSANTVIPHKSQCITVVYLHAASKITQHRQSTTYTTVALMHAYVNVSTYKATVVTTVFYINELYVCGAPIQPADDDRPYNALILDPSLSSRHPHRCPNWQCGWGLRTQDTICFIKSPHAVMLHARAVFMQRECLSCFHSTGIQTNTSRLGQQPKAWRRAS